MATTATGGDGGHSHRYYELLPPHVTRASVERERLDLLERVQQTLALLKQAGAGDEVELQAHHFRAVSTFFDLKHELPTDVHAELIAALVDVLWTSDGPAPLGDVNLENRAIKTLALLLRAWKWRVGSGDDSQRPAIDWRVVRKAVERACFSSPGCFRRASQPWLAQIADNTVKSAEQARAMFRSADRLLVSELWEELGPGIKDSSRMECFQQLALFSLLVSFPEGDAATEAAVEQLLPEWVAAWSQISRCSEWDAHWIKILSRVAKRFPNSQMWSAYLPFIFAKIHDCLALPSDLGAPPKNHAWPSAALTLNGSKPSERHIGRLLVYLMNNPDDAGVAAPANQYVHDILHTVKAFFHPSNVSNVAGAVVPVLHSLGRELAYRLGREKAGENAGRVLVLSSVQSVLDELLQIALLGIYSKSRAVSSNCALVIKLVVCIDPVSYTTVVLDEMVRALDPSSMSQSHLAVTSISSMAAFLFHLMCGRDQQSTGAFYTTYLVPILKLTLPGIDANDERKTLATTMLYFQVLSWLPLINDLEKGALQATKIRGKLSEEVFEDMKTTAFVDVREMDAETDQRLWELGSFFEEWSLSLLSRCFQFFTSRASAAEQATSSAGHGGRGHSSGKSDDSDDDQISMQVANMLSLLYAQMSPQVYAQALRQTTSFVSSLFFTTSSSGHVVEQLLYSCLQGSPAVAFKQLAPIVFDKFLVTKTSIDVASLTTSEKLWNLYLLNGMVRFNDPDDRFLLAYRDELRVILHHFLTKEEDKEVYEAASRVLQHLLIALFGVYTHDFRSLPREQWLDAVSSESGAFQYLGVSVSWKRLSISWHEPNADELAFGLELLQTHLLTPLDELKELESKKDTTVKAWSNRLNRVLNSIRGAASILVDGASIASESALLNGAMPLLKNALGENEEVLGRFIALKPLLMTRVHELVTFWRKEGSGGTVEIPLVRLLLRIISQLVIWRGKPNGEFRMKKRQSAFAKRASMDPASYAFQKALNKGNSYEPLTVASRNDKVEMVNFFNELRSVQQHFALANAIFQNQFSSDVKHSYEHLLGDVEGMLKHTYEPVRAEAAQIMQDTHELYAKWLYSRLPSLVDELRGSTDSPAVEIREETVSGVLFMLTLTLARRNMWGRHDRLLSRVLQILLKSDELIANRVDSEASKVKVNAKLQTYFMMLLASWRSVGAHRGGSTNASVLQELIKAEPEATEHWKFQLMHLVMLYPFLQPEQSPMPVELWSMVIRQTRSDVLPVRQIALLLFALLVKLHKHEKPASDSTDALLYSSETLSAVVTSVFDNYKNSNRFAASADGQHAESAPSNWSFGVNDVLRHLSAGPNSFPKSPFLSSVRVMNQTSDSMSQVSLPTIKLVEKLVLTNPSRFFASGVMDLLNDMAAERTGASAALEDRQAALSTLADWTAGMLHALVKVEGSLSEQEVDSQIAKVLGLLKSVLPSLSVVLIDQWTQVLYLSSRASKHRAVKLQRLEPLLMYLLGELEDSFAHATVEDYARQAKWLALVEVVAVHFLGASTSAATAQTDAEAAVRSITTLVCDRLVRVLTTHALAHQYKIIRQGAGRLLFILGAYALSTTNPPLAPSVIPLDKLVAATALDWSSAPSSSDDVTAEDDGGVALRAKETAMHWLDNCQQFGDVADVAAVLPQLLPVALLSQNHPKAEVAVQAKNTSDAVSKALRLFALPQRVSRHEAGTVDGLLDLLAAMGRSPIWKTRGAVIRFLVTFVFYHWVALTAAQKQRVHDLVGSFLTDDQREVQAMAKFALRSLVHNESDAAVRAMSVRLTAEAAEARVKFPKQRRRLERLEKDAATQADEVAQAQERLRATEGRMTRSVLGMSAIVLAFPHETPAFVPPMFEELGRFLYLQKHRSATVSFLEKAVKETLLEFRRTHQDNWRETKAKFSRAQLDVLEDVAIAPSYFS